MTPTPPGRQSRRPRPWAPWLVLALALLLTAAAAAYVSLRSPDAAAGGWLPLAVLLVGLAFDFALFFIARSQARARREAEAAEADLRASEARFRSLVEQSPVSTQTFSPDGRTVRVNRAWEELWGVTLERLGSYNILEDPQLEEKGIAQYIRRGFAGEAARIPAILYDPEETIPGKTTHRDPRRWVSAVIYPVKDEEGRVREVVLIHEDITEQRRAEEQLLESHRRVNDILESISDAFYAVDSDWRFTYVNRRAEEHLGRRREDLLGRNLWEEFPRVVDSSLHAELLRAARDRRPVGFEARSLIHDSWIEVSVYPTGGGLSVYFRDITERKRAEATLREQTEVVETVNRVGQLLTSELDLRKVVQAVTDAATELTGARFGSFFYNLLDEHGASYMLYTLSGVPAEAFAHFPMPRATDLFCPTFRGEGAVRIADVKLDARYGKNSPYFGMPGGHLPVTSYLAVPVASRTGEVLGGLFLGHPEAGVFTERHGRLVEGLAAQAAVAMDNARLFEAARTERERAQEANRLKDEFLATLSHELRTPLTSVLGWAKLLRTERFDARVTNHALEVIERNAVAQTRLINDLLDVSRIITGKLRLNVAPVELAPVIEAAVESLRPAAEARGVHLRFAPGGAAGPVNGDADRLQQVVWNLLSNAIKFTPRGGRVDVSLAGGDDHAEVVVSDTGRGIAPEFLPHVFERFRQADGAITREHGGLGLGLSIVRYVVELHGGRVRVESEGEGRGAAFTVSLPLIRTRGAQRAAPDEERRGPDPAPGAGPQASILSGLHVLVVEDDEDSRALLSAILETAGARVSTAASAAAAFAKLRSLRPDVLVADIGMPGEDGCALLRRVRALDPAEGGATPAAALTAYARPEDRAQALEAGYQLHIAKPVTPAALTEAVASLSGRRQEG